jgi:hypothetical protein
MTTNALRVTATSLNLRQDPDPASPVVALLPRDAILVERQDQRSDANWVGVTWQGKQGFVARQFVAPDSPAAPVPGGGPSVDPTKRSVDLTFLHPVYRAAAAAVLDDLAAAGIPLRIFEAYRTPERQQFLYDQGRTRPGSIVTKAQAWQSYHQYGLAADYVAFVNGSWSWDGTGERAQWWTQLHVIGRKHGLEPLSFEAPHLQLAGLTTGGLVAGKYPDGGDESWTDNLTSTIARWQGSPAAPPPPRTRPPLDV